MTTTERRLARYAEAVRLVDEGKARSQVVEAVECLRAGMTWREAIAHLGISRSTFYQRLNDPTDEANRARKAKGNGTCEECGAPTAYGVGGPARRCAACYRSQNKERNARLIELWEMGWSAARIGDELGMSPEAVTSWVDDQRQRHGIPITLHRRQNTTDIERQRVIKLWEAGVSAEEIAAACGMKNRASLYSAIYAWRGLGYEIPLRDRYGNLREAA